MLNVHVKAPFGAFRLFTAGSYRPSAPCPTHSAVYGLLLNIAGIESRFDDGRSPMTMTAKGLPACKLALGLFIAPEVQVLFQQLHNYPVGSTGKEHSAETKGNKYNIQPISREILSGLDFCALVDGNDALEEGIRHGLTQGTANSSNGRPRYGVPFLGDNNLFLSHLSLGDPTTPAAWLRTLGAEESGVDATRLYTWVDRADNTRTKSQMFVVETKMSLDPPDSAWIPIQPS